MTIACGLDDLIGPWVAEGTGGQWVAGRGTTIGLIDDETQRPLAGVLYEDWNGKNVCVHIRAETGRNWAQREFLWFIFYYPFEQLGASRLTAIVAGGNEKSVEFVERLGFVLEATLKDAHPTGDLLVYVMRKAECRWLSLKGARSGQEQQQAKDSGLRRSSEGRGASEPRPCEVADQHQSGQPIESLRPIGVVAQAWSRSE